MWADDLADRGFRRYLDTRLSGTTGALFAVNIDIGSRTAVGDLGTILRTTDGGATWKAESRTASFDNLAAVFFSDSKKGTVVGANGTILRTTDGGVTWTPQPSGTSNWLWGVAFADTNNGTVVGEQGLILRTRDGGVTWSAQKSATTVSLRGVSFAGPNSETVVGANGTILQTTDGGDTWSSRSSGTSNWLNGVVFADANTGTAVGDGGTILRTTDGGVTWKQQVTSPTRSRLQSVSMAGSNTAIAVGDFQNVIVRTTDSGAHWAIQPSGVRNILSGVWFTDANTGIVVGGQGSCSPSISTILRTTDGGAHMEAAGYRHEPGSARGVLHRREHGLGSRRTRHDPAHDHRRRAARVITHAAGRVHRGMNIGGMNMKALFRIFIAGMAAAVSFAGTAAAQTIVTGTGNPDVDIAAVQAAVDRGGAVVLRGHFSFDNPPAKRGALPDLMATVLVRKRW